MTRALLPGLRPVVLIVLDGWGCREEKEQNAIAAARTPHWSRLWREYPHGLIQASELHVGLPEGQMGNSEVGHMNIGSGRVVMQDLPRIDQAIADGSLARNPALQSFITKLKAFGGDCHLLGLLSPGGVHSHQAHLAALARIVAGQGIRVWMHAFLDGRDTPPQSALDYILQFEKDIAGHANIRVGALCGRYYAMDRDRRWERIALAYRMLVEGEGASFSTAQEAVQASYASGASDEFVPPAVIGNYRGMQGGDGLLIGNFRADRVRQIASALLLPDFGEFERQRVVAFAAALGMVEYSQALNPCLDALFPSQKLEGILGEAVSAAGLRQLRIAETEKYAHVTFFFNGGREEVFPGEDRILIPSPKVATYDLQPEMSAFEVTDKAVEAIDARRYDLIVMNYANTDMVGHTGNLQAAIRAAEAVDACLGRLLTAVERANGALVITADHGNAEMMHDAATRQAHTAHTLNPVPLLVATSAWRGRPVTLPEGRLADIAPTVLALMGLPQPPQMTGRPLLL